MSTITFPIKIEDVEHVYSGKVGKCACGCSGKHSYPSSLKDQGVAIRGYELDNDDISDMMVKKVTNMINNAQPIDLEYGDNCVWIDTETRTYVVYLKES